MMKEALQALLDAYTLQTQEDYENALREVVQQIALLGLWRAKFFEHAAFYGGTALRTFYGLNRASEDLDFSLLEPNQGFRLESYINAIESELTAFGFLFHVESKKKKLPSPIESAFIKGNTVKNLISVEAPEQIVKGFPPGKKLKIKLEIDIDPPAGANVESKFLLRPIPFSVRLYTQSSLFAGKIHALLCRSWGTRVKGRDLYDFVWYLAEKIPCNLEHVRQRMIQTGHWDREKPLSHAQLILLLEQRFEKIDFEMAKTDVRPFLKNIDELELWSREFFLQISREILIGEE